jgi:hypothetical protein
MAEHTHSEKDLYPPVKGPEKALYRSIEDLMVGQGYTVIPQFKAFFPLADRTRWLDLLGFRWTDDGDLDAWAVEAKKGDLPSNALSALPQAVEYQLYVPRVSVAAEVRGGCLAFAEEPLKKLGLGYIHATRKLAHATPKLAKEIIPAPSTRCFENEANYVIRHAGVLCLIGREWWKKGGYRENNSGGFYGIHNSDPVQYQLATSGKRKKVYLEIWIQPKRVLARIYKELSDKVERERLAKLLAKLAASNSGATAKVSKYEMDPFGRLGKCLGELPLSADKTVVAKTLRRARAWHAGRRHISAISVNLELWAWDAMPGRAEAEKTIEQAIEGLEPTRAYLADMAE